MKCKRQKNILQRFIIKVYFYLVIFFLFDGYFPFFKFHLYYHLSYDISYLLANILINYLSYFQVIYLFSLSLYLIVFFFLSVTLVLHLRRGLLHFHASRFRSLPCREVFRQPAIPKRRPPGNFSQEKN